MDICAKSYESTLFSLLILQPAHNSRNITIQFFIELQQLRGCHNKEEIEQYMQEVILVIPEVGGQCTTSNYEAYHIGMLYNHQGCGIYTGWDGFLVTLQKADA